MLVEVLLMIFMSRVCSAKEKEVNENAVAVATSLEI